MDHQIISNFRFSDFHASCKSSYWIQKLLLKFPLLILSNAKSILRIVSLVFLFAVANTNANAFIKVYADCQPGQSKDDCYKNGGLKEIFIYEEIVLADAQQFAEIDANLTAEKPFPKVSITSRGGSVLAAMKIGRILRQRNAKIEGRDLFFPNRPARCDSACVTLSAGAVDRQFDEIGVHRPYYPSSDKNCKLIQTEVTDSDLEKNLKYYTEMGMPLKLFEYLKSTPSARLSEFYFDPDSEPEEQMIVQFGFRMHPTAPDSPKMFSPNGKPRFTNSIDLLERGVEEGNLDAVSGLAKLYEEISEYDPSEFENVIKWYEKAGELGSDTSYHNLGVMFNSGRGVKKDQTKAAYYFRKAADMGYAGSQNNLGWAYYKGEGVEKNYGLAIYWITRAIEQGEPFAYSSLGEMRLYAHGFPPDDVEAYKWIILADKSLPRGKAQDDNELLLKQLKNRMQPDEIAKAESLSKLWKPLKQTDVIMENKCEP
jgi:TPR repeat protein